MVMAAALLDTLPTPSNDGVGKVYHQLKGILGIADEQQAESSLQQRAEVSILSPGHSKASQQRTTTEHPTAGTASSPTRALSHLWPSHHHVVRLVEGAMGHAPSTTRATCVGVGAVIENSVALASRGQGLKHSGATCVTRASLSTSVTPTFYKNKNFVQIGMHIKL
jgi:hypothetical protein